MPSVTAETTEVTVSQREQYVQYLQYRLFDVRPSSCFVILFIQLILMTISIFPRLCLLIKDIYPDIYPEKCVIRPFHVIKSLKERALEGDLD